MFVTIELSFSIAQLPTNLIRIVTQKFRSQISKNAEMFLIRGKQYSEGIRGPSIRDIKVELSETKPWAK